MSRRSFLERLGVVAMVVLGGSAISTLFARRAGARQCGQEGIAPSCDTFDCVGDDLAWGWCWYATPGACCVGGGLKKICDCCKVDHPYYQGYCPDGMAVYCMVESCLADPRHHTVPLDRTRPATAFAAALEASQRWADGSAPSVVLADERDPRVLVLAAPVAAFLDGPLLLLEGGDLTQPVLDVLARLGSRVVKIVGPGLPLTIDARLSVPGRRVERLHGAADLATAAEEVARWVLSRSRRRRVVYPTADVLGDLGVLHAIGSFAATRRSPVVFSAESARRVGSSERTGTAIHVIGSDPAAMRELLVGAVATTATTPRGLVLEVAAWTLEERRGDATLTIVPEGSLPVSLGAIPRSGPVVSHPDGVLGTDLRDWIIEHQHQLARAHSIEPSGGLSLDDLYALQAALNRYDVHLLVGGDGDGFPVYFQLPEEESIGGARERGPVPSWTRITDFDDFGNYIGPPLEL